MVQQLEFPLAKVNQNEDIKAKDILMIVCQMKIKSSIEKGSLSLSLCALHIEMEVFMYTSTIDQDSNRLRFRAMPLC